MQVVPYFYFNGNAEEALKFYADVFKAKAPAIMRYKDQPSPNLPVEHEEMILHSELIIQNSTFYISDAVGDHAVKVGDNIQINLNCDSEEQIQGIYEQLKTGGQVRMPLQDTFWGALFGSLTDQFGITWSLNFQKAPMK